MKTLGFGSLVVIVFCQLIAPPSLRGEDVANWEGSVQKVKGHYEYDKDGVPLLGLITAELKNNRVKFTTCSNTTIEVSSNELKPTLASCPNSAPGQGPWNAESRNVVYLVKGAPGSSTVQTKVGGSKISLSRLPEADRKLVAEAKPGDTVGIKFTASDGKPTIGLFATPLQ
jgi:hypothetical protein